MKPLSEKRPDRRDAILRAAVLLFCVLLNTFTLVRAVLRGEPYWVRCLVGYVLLLLPLAAERLFSFRMRPFVFIPMQLFVLAAVLGKCYHLFYICPVWDVLTHFWGGAELAVCGAFLFQYLERDCRTDGSGSRSRALSAALAAVCFAAAVGVCWELFEFAADSLFGWDMMMDTVVSRIDSSLLGGQPWEVSAVEDIRETMVNGTKLPVEGYLDIGLIDTMEDLAFLMAGTVPVAVACLAAKGRNVFFRFVPRAGKAVESALETDEKPPENT